MNKTNRPNYKLIFSDLIQKKHPSKLKDFETYLRKDTLSALDVIQVNELLTSKGCKNTKHFNQQLRSFNEKEIIEILKYQKRNHLNNVQLAQKFKLSRNTVSKWKKLFKGKF